MIVQREMRVNNSQNACKIRTFRNGFSEKYKDFLIDTKSFVFL